VVLLTVMEHDVDLNKKKRKTYISF